MTYGKRDRLGDDDGRLGGGAASHGDQLFPGVAVNVDSLIRVRHPDLLLLKCRNGGDRVRLASWLGNLAVDSLGVKCWCAKPLGRLR